MIREVSLKFLRGLWAGVIVLLLSQPAFAQHLITVLPHGSNLPSSPISFMRPHYLVHRLLYTRVSAPPASALTPAQTRHAYGFDRIANQGAGQIIGIVDAYDDPNVQSDLAAFDQQFGLPACTSSNGCLQEVYENGSRPAANANWSVEIALDVEWAHAIAPQATIVLVEATSNSLSDLTSAVDVAVGKGASVVSMSWTAGEFSGETRLDNHFAVNGVTFLAASGDSGTGVVYPAASPDVIGVGGTQLTLDSKGNYAGETAWTGSGGGQSSYENEPLFQAEFAIPDNGSGARGAPDVSYNADPSMGYAVYETYGVAGRTSRWIQVGGTSAGTVQWAGLLAIVNSIRTAARKAPLSSTNATLYSLATLNFGANFYPVTQGSNGSCGTICTALAGYDFVTGLGTPQGGTLISSLSSQP